MTQSEHGRDAGVIFENTESARQTDTHAPREEGASPGQREHRRDAGVTFENTGSPRKTDSRAKRDEGVVPSPGEHSRDAGVTFENAESDRQAEIPVRPDAGVSGTQRSRDAGVVFENVEGPRKPDGGTKAFDGNLLFSVLGLGAAATRFTLDQMRNAVSMMTDPFHAMERLQHSIDNFSKALNESVKGTPSPSGGGKP